MFTKRQHERTYRVGHIACSIGAGAAGFGDAEARVENIRARFECAGGIDVDPARIANFERMTGAKGTVMDLFSRDQYVAYHGQEPPAEWREATPADMRAAFGGDVDVVFASPPCRGLTSLLTPGLADSAKYQALNQLTVRGVMLALEAFVAGGLKLFLLENVPGLATKGRPLVNQIKAVLHDAGFSVAESSHDCGEIGGLAQHRKRFLLVARHMERVPPFLYQPRRVAMRSVGEILGGLPKPGDPAAGPMHRIPALNWKTWKRLAFIEAGADWRSLSDLDVRGGKVHGLALDRVSPGASMAAFPSAGTANASFQRSGSVADRCAYDDGLPTYALHAVVTGRGIADPRAGGKRGGRGKYRINRLDEASGTVIGNSSTGEGAFALADPSPWTIADGTNTMPKDTDPLVARIVASDGTWHRPYTAYELAALQSLIPPGGVHFDFERGSETDKRLWIGDAVPRAAAKGMAETMLQTLLLADTGVTYQLSSEEIWAMPLGVEMSVDLGARGGGYDIDHRMA